MIPAVIDTPRLRLDAPTSADRGLVVEYCQDPVFERFLTLPWPYTGRDADYFIGKLVPHGWEQRVEYTWAIRRKTDDDGTGASNRDGNGDGHGDLLGVIGFRVGAGSIGFWLGSPHRGFGYMPEAVRAVTAWLFEAGVAKITWECVVGNTASAAVARKCGFHFSGERPATLTYRDGTRPPSWHGFLAPADTGEPQPGWPEQSILNPHSSPGPQKPAELRR